MHHVRPPAVLHPLHRGLAGHRDRGGRCREGVRAGASPGSTIYEDMEGYDQTNSSCSQAVLTFLSAWTAELHAHGYLSGVYSSLGSGISDLGSQYGTGTYNLPDSIWFAWWNGAADTNTGSYVPASYWANHQRVHQYTGDTDETWGGVTMNVDDDYLDLDSGSVATCTASLDFTAYTALSSGATGDPVSAAQCLLLRQGYFAGAVNGTFGADTASAASAFQTAKALTASGAVDSHTWTALLSAGTKPSLQSGSTGADVQRLQRALTAALGQTVGIDGDFGSQTTTAVKSYQSSRGLTADGAVGPLTWGALQSGK
ncbi:glycoside hydrolase domain-containing protein [Kitasatospora paranensis]|uniref:glycoside hydrolase domain-containing protein n=1 Tax=Kitasatospora paranensis TaxID=258053 RepID=UPI0031E874FC